MRYHRQSFIGLILIAILGFELLPLSSLAAAVTLADLDEGFNPYAILDDRDLFDLGSMNQASIQQFLDERGTLGQRKFRDIDGQDKPTAAIIWRVATSYKINPRYLMALMQKEQSLVEDRDPSESQLDWAMGFGVCDSCSKSDPRIQDFKGFANQMEYAAKQHRERYLFQILSKGSTIAGYAPGKEALIDGLLIVPSNQATAMLYSYTPHIHGNQNLWRIWRRWFALTFPDGTVVRGKTSKNVYLISYGQRRQFASLAVASSMVDPNKIVMVDDSSLNGYAEGPVISFPNYALVETPDGQRYLIVGQKKRLIKDTTVFSKLGFSEDELIPSAAEELSGYENGSDITSASAYPAGLLIKDTLGRYWYVEDGVRRYIPNRTFLTLYFKGQPAKAVTDIKLKTYRIGDDYALRDGELVRTATKSAVYVIEKGWKRPIPSEKVFTELGYNWKNVVQLPDKLLNEYPLGENVNPHALPPAPKVASSI